MPWIETLESLLHHTIEVCIILMELIGVIVMVVTAITCFIRWLRKDMEIGLRLAQGIALALEFKLGGEVLRTVIVREWAELGILGAIIVLRGLLTMLIHWEIKNERKAIAEHRAAKIAERRAELEAMEKRGKIAASTAAEEKPKDMRFS